MVVDQQSLLEDKDRLEELRRSYDGEARLNESFIVLTVGASLIASLGLVADNNAVIIGAMVVAPWILPLRVAVFAILIGQARLLSRSLITLVAGAGITLILSMGLGWASSHALKAYLWSRACQNRSLPDLSPTHLIWGSPWLQVPSRPTPRSTRVP